MLMVTTGIRPKLHLVSQARVFLNLVCGLHEAIKHLGQIMRSSLQKEVAAALAYKELYCEPYK